MIDTPHLEERAPRSYVAIRRTVAADDFAAAFDECFPHLVRWLEEHQVRAAGPAMVRYRSDDEHGYDIDMAFPVASPPDVDDGAVTFGVLPGGTYAVVTTVGSFDDVAEEHGTLDEWIAAEGHVQDVAGSARVEIYVTDPRSTTDTTPIRVAVEQLLAVG